MMPRNTRDVGQQRFGKLIALLPIYVGKTKWVCACDCGNTVEVRLTQLLSGIVKSCGCLRKKHGMHGAPEYNIWQSMIRRCCDPRHEHFADYGGRGISVCDAWRNDFAAFYRSVGPRPSVDHSIDRINNDGSYEPGNVRWATVLEQAANRRHPRGRRRSTIDGEKISVRQMASYLAISHFAFKHLLEDAGR